MEWLRSSTLVNGVTSLLRRTVTSFRTRKCSTKVVDAALAWFIKSVAASLVSAEATGAAVRSSYESYRILPMGAWLCGGRE